MSLRVVEWEPITDALVATRRTAGGVASFGRPSRLVEAERRAVERFLAAHDAMTGLPNRATFDDDLKTAIDAAHRYELLPAVLVIDLDGFQAINDTFGHAVGDQHLQRIAATLEGAARRGDTVARIGDHTFAILLPNATSHAAHDATVRFSRAIEQLVSVAPCSSASVGVAIFVPGDAPETMLARATTDMHDVKSARELAP